MVRAGVRVDIGIEASWMWVLVWKSMSVLNMEASGWMSELVRKLV